mgnify:FL=1|tara:strand:+ start:1449 stop:1865 length:417 start_codon:yes stop_codon:yes gene_type:complete
MAIFTEDNIVEYFPDLHNYGIQDFNDMISKTESDIHRLLRIEWFPTLRTSSGDYDPTKVKDSQLTRSAVYYCLFKYILPQLTQWAVEGDSFQTQIEFYSRAFYDEFDLAKRELFYDWNDDGTYDESERELQPRQRLVR